MSDLFHPDVPDDFIVEVCEVMLEASWHTFQVLTKRSKRMSELLNSKLRFAARHEHIWWGTSVENKKHGIPRIEQLRDAGVSIRFLSVEPLLEDLGDLDLRGIHWMIVGGESGPGARAMDARWVRSLEQQCRRSDVPFFFKQWGGVRKTDTGRELDGITYNDLPVIG